MKINKVFVNNVCLISLRSIISPLPFVQWMHLFTLLVTYLIIYMVYHKPNIFLYNFFLFCSSKTHHSLLSVIGIKLIDTEQNLPIFSRELMIFSCFSNCKRWNPVSVFGPDLLLKFVFLCHF